MPSILLTAPAAEPLSLAEAKAFLRVEHNDDDDVIGALIASASAAACRSPNLPKTISCWQVTPRRIVILHG